MAGRYVQVVHKQYNSPMGLYSPEAVAETLKRQTRVLANGAVGVDFRLLAAPSLAKSKVLKMLNEQGETNYEPGENFPHQSNENPSRILKDTKWRPAAVKHTAPLVFNESSNSSQGVKEVAWPPSSPTPYFDGGDGDVGCELKPVDEATAALQTRKSPPPVPPKPRRNNEDPDRDMAQIARKESPKVPAPFASNELIGDRPLIAKPSPPPGLISYSLRDQVPLNQTPRETVASEPLFKRCAPLRRLGDMVWPPKRPGQPDNEEQSQSIESVKPKREPKNYRGFFLQNQLPASFPTYRAPPGTQHFGLENGENETPM